MAVAVAPPGNTSTNCIVPRNQLTSLCCAQAFDTIDADHRTRVDRLAYHVAGPHLSSLSPHLEPAAPAVVSSTSAKSASSSLVLIMVGPHISSASGSCPPPPAASRPRCCCWIADCHAGCPLYAIALAGHEHAPMSCAELPLHSPTASWHLIADHVAVVVTDDDERASAEAPVATDKALCMLPAVYGSRLYTAHTERTRIKSAETEVKTVGRKSQLVRRR